MHEIKGYLEAKMRVPGVVTTDNGYIMRECCEPVVLIHVTTGDRVESIRAHGLKTSEFGDIDIIGNDGAGLYAMLPDYASARQLASDLVPGEPAYAVIFRYEQTHFICDGVTERDEEDSPPDYCKGYVVIPADVGSVVVAPDTITVICPLW